MITIGCVRMMSITVSPLNFVRSYTQMTASHRCLILHEVLNMRTLLQRPFHVGHHSSQRVTLLPATLQHLLKELDHPVLIETAAPQVSILPIA